MLRQELLKMAHDKVENMSYSELKMFNNVITIDSVITKIMSHYSVGDVVEYMAYVPGIGFEYCGDRSRIKLKYDDYVILENGESKAYSLIKPAT